MRTTEEILQRLYDSFVRLSDSSFEEITNGCAINDLGKILSENHALAMSLVAEKVLHEADLNGIILKPKITKYEQSKQPPTTAS